MSESSPQTGWAAGFLVAACLGLAGAFAALGAGAKDLAWFGLAAAGVVGLAFAVARPRVRADGSLANPMPRRLLPGGSAVLAALLAVLFVALCGERLGLSRSEPGTASDEAAPSAGAIVAFRHGADSHGVLIVRSDLGFGSGVVVRREGDVCFVLTAQHVVAGAGMPRIRCYADAPRLNDFVDRDADTHEDPACSPVLAFDAVQDWAVCAMFDPGGRARPPDACRSGAAPGEWVLALGNPGTGQAFHDDGHIRGTRDRGGLSCLLHDALLDHGSSGGPLFGADFALIGINIGSWTPDGAREPLGVANPAHDILRSLAFAAPDIPDDAIDWQNTGLSVSTGDRIRVAVRRPDGRVRFGADIEFRVDPGGPLAVEEDSDARVAAMTSPCAGRLLARPRRPGDPLSASIAVLRNNPAGR